MNRTLKWILFVLLGVVVLAMVAVGIIAIFGFFRSNTIMGPGIPWDGHMGFNSSPLRLFFIGLLCLGFILLFIVGVIALVAALARGNRPVSVTPAVTPTAPVIVAERPCPSCGRMTQTDWKNCPYCGNPLFGE
jgi:hypothetical protein